MKAAFVSAAVAFIVLALTQVFVHRRERSRLLLAKLEELYLLLLSLGERNGKRFDAFLNAGGPTMAPLPKLSVEEIILSDLLEKIRLLVEFYFPQLQPELDAIFEVNRECIGVLVPKPNHAQMMEVAQRFPNFNEALKERILRERGLLTKNWWDEVRHFLDRRRKRRI